MPRFSTDTKSLLIKAGWQEGRKVETTGYEQVLIDEGFEIPNCAITLLQPGRVGKRAVRHSN